MKSVSAGSYVSVVWLALAKRDMHLYEATAKWRHATSSRKRMLTIYTKTCDLLLVVEHLQLWQYKDVR